MIVVLMIQLNILAFAALVFTAHKLLRAYRHYRYRVIEFPKLSADELPAVSVCLPARNENSSMTECLESVLASDYPKLEIIVLDDDSSDNTSNLIKAFAHSGVRFVQGAALPEGWLGKNYALHTLLEEASGRYVLFMDVDTRLSTTTVSQLVAHVIAKDRDMVSVIPQRYDTYRPSAWMGTLRFFWELLLDSPRRPGSSAALWMVNRHFLSEELRGFEPWRDQIQPELYIARECLRRHGYTLLVSTPALGASFAKKWSSQVESARRMLLPGFYNSTLGVLVGVGMLLAIILPQVAWIVAVLEGNWLLFAVEFVLAVFLAGVSAAYFGLVWRSRRVIGVLLTPWIAWQELWLLIASAIGYRMGTITWKGRPVGRPPKQRAVVD